MANAGIFSPDSRPYGKTYGQWAEKWIKWSLSISKSSNPILDETGENCAESQSGPVWFLAGTLGTLVRRKCCIPPNKGIFFPVIEKECSFAEEGDQLKTEEELVSRVRHLMDVVLQLDVEIDGNKLENLYKYRALSNIFDLSFPEDNVYGVSKGKTRSVTDGYWIMLKPLPLGHHTIYFCGSSQIPKGPSAIIANRFVKVEESVFRTEVYYDIKIS